ncbi:MAG TPA: DUF2269 family protein [Actinomycetota bacterium]|nr:DUF2269 family protein [Actinomycetota bacterium]
MAPSRRRGRGGCSHSRPTRSSSSCTCSWRSSPSGSTRPTGSGSRAPRENRSISCTSCAGSRCSTTGSQNPAYALLLVTGLVMVWVGDLELTQFWLAGGLTLYVVAVVLGLFVYTPTLRRQIQAIQTGDAAELQRLSARGTAVGVAIAVDVVVIVFLMVTKPTP